jgi:hypothetical protein
MRLRTRAAILVAAATAAIGLTTVPASAATVHRAHIHCFNVSWQNGWSATVYYHNTCGSTQHIAVAKGSDTRWCGAVKAHAKGHHKTWLPAGAKVVWRKSC